MSHSKIFGVLVVLRLSFGVQPIQQVRVEHGCKLRDRSLDRREP